MDECATPIDLDKSATPNLLMIVAHKNQEIASYKLLDQRSFHSLHFPFSFYNDGNKMRSTGFDGIDIDKIGIAYWENARAQGGFH